jgi:glycosyltransferase involved in cell wall biosynthesis
VRTVLFHRKYRRFHGGHLKVWHYFNHVLATPGFDARVLFDVDSSWDRSNPWFDSRDYVVESLNEISPDALFVAGRDWQRLDALGLLDRGLPVLNLIQHVRHADEWSIQSRYLDRKAIRICVSVEVADAIVAAGSNGPTIVIPNSVDLPLLEDQTPAERPIDLLIAGLKQPVMANQLQARLKCPELTIVTLTDHVAREEFLEAMRRARVTLFLPNREEGFYLPALEGMALGTLVVCPDCIGNRAYLSPARNALVPEFALDALAQSTEQALALGMESSSQMVASARETAARHSPSAEREAFARVLNDLDRLWASGG